MTGFINDTQELKHEILTLKIMEWGKKNHALKISDSEAEGDIRNIKFYIRTYYREQEAKNESKVICDFDSDDSINGYVEKITCPANITTEAMADRYFRNNYYVAYDMRCDTPDFVYIGHGEYTLDYKIVKRSDGRFVIYNEMALVTY